MGRSAVGSGEVAGVLGERGGKALKACVPPALPLGVTLFQP